MDFIHIIAASEAMIVELEVLQLLSQANAPPARKKRRYWVRPIGMAREQRGHFSTLVQEMRLQETESFRNFHRMSVPQFQELLAIVGPSITEQEVVRKPIPAAERLSLTLRYLAIGDAQISLGKYDYRIGHSTTSRIILETCQAIWDNLHNEVLKKPDEAKWTQIAQGFSSKLKFPNCVGAIDGKHVVVQAFNNSNSSHWNYKHQHSVVLMAVCDSGYKFTYVDIGAAGRHSDGGIFRRSSFGSAIVNEDARLNIPPSSVLPNSDIVVPHVFVGDEAFPLLPNLMRPYPGRATGRMEPHKANFNYWLSKSRIVIENAFGLMATQWRIFRRPINCKRKTVVAIVQATVCLQNFLLDRNPRYLGRGIVDTEDSAGRIIEGSWRSNQIEGLQPLGRLGSNNPPDSAIVVRDKFTTFLRIRSAADRDSTRDTSTD